MSQNSHLHASLAFPGKSRLQMYTFNSLHSFIEARVDYYVLGGQQTLLLYLTKKYLRSYANSLLEDLRLSFRHLIANFLHLAGEL